MAFAFHIPVSALNEQNRRLELLGENISNLNTPGYKVERMTFLETLGTITGVPQMKFEQGPVTYTGNPSDLAIKGDSFFILRSGEESLYTRVGAFSFDKNGQLINADGYKVQGWVKDLTGKQTDIVQGAPGDVVIDPIRTMSAQKTKNVWFSGNLDASLENVAEVWASSSAFTTKDGETATYETEINDLFQVTEDLVNGDKLLLTGKLSDGTEVEGEFTYDDGTTLGDIVDFINTEYSGSATAKIVEGKIVLTDEKKGDSETRINLTPDEGNVGEITIPNFTNTVAGVTARVNSSIVVYDSLGKSHNLFIEFTPTETKGEWAWTISTDGEGEIVEGGTGKIFFDSSGNYVSLVYDEDKSAVVINPKNGAEQMAIQIHGDPRGGLIGLTQFDSASSAYGRDQDGFTSGFLTDFEFKADGSIIGYFTNGKQDVIAQIALAQFANPQGLRKAEGSNFRASDESGMPRIGDPDSQSASIEPESLELSTVDLADQFTKLIETQRAYQAAAKVVSTFEEITDETVRLKR